MLSLRHFSHHRVKARQKGGRSRVENGGAVVQIIETWRSEYNVYRTYVLYCTVHSVQVVNLVTSNGNNCIDIFIVSGQ